MHAIILAGGLGTRLRSVVPDIPKPMAPVGGAPFLEHLLRQLASSGIVEATLCVGYRASAISDHFGNGAALGMSLRYSVENEPLGTAGALRLAAATLPSDRWLVMNGDSYFGIDLSELLAADAARPGVATISLRPLPDASRYGRVAIDDEGAVVGFWEKEQQPAIGAEYMNAGVYVIGRELTESIAMGRQVSLERETLPAFVGRGLLGAVFDAPFIDIGVPEDYARLVADPTLIGLRPG